MSNQDDQLRAALKAEIAQLFADSVTVGAKRAAYFFKVHENYALEIAVKARKEPKTKALPSPFVYSMQ